MSTQAGKLSIRCCIAGGGPAGMMLGLALARAGIPVIVLEKHADFLRDFRGDTVHPSTLQILDQLGLIEKFLPMLHRFPQLKIQFADTTLAVADFSRLEPFPYMGFAPQWDFLNLLTEEGRRYPHFKLMMNTEATGLIRSRPDDTVTGVRARHRDGRSFEINADLTVATDGRHSTLREAAGLTADEFGAPMDALWFRIDQLPSDPPDAFGVAGRGQLVAMLNRKTYWQIAFIIPKGSADAMMQRPIEDFRARVERAVPLLRGRAGQLKTWDEVKLLVVQVNRLRRWHLPGLLLIGDAAHAMSPAGGVGINLAIQDAIATANIVGPTLRDGGPVPEDLLRRVQQRRELPTRLTQAIQIRLQDNLIAGLLRGSGEQPKAPWLLKQLTRFRWIREIPARAFGLGFRRETLKLPPATT